MIVVSLLLFLAGVGLLAAGLVSESITMEVGSIGAALLAAMVLYLGVRRRGTPAEPDESPGPQNFTPLPSASASDWSDPQREGPAGSSERADWHPDPADGAVPAADSSHEWADFEALEAAEAMAGSDEPDEEVVSPADAQRVAGRDDDVLVVDGRPRYHLELCAALGDDETVPLPVSEAREAGFTPCARCRPDSHILDGAWRSGSTR